VKLTFGLHAGHTTDWLLVNACEYALDLLELENADPQQAAVQQDLLLKIAHVDARRFIEPCVGRNCPDVARVAEMAVAAKPRLDEGDFEPEIVGFWCEACCAAKAIPVLSGKRLPMEIEIRSYRDAAAYATCIPRDDDDPDNAWMFMREFFKAKGLKLPAL